MPSTINFNGRFPYFENDADDSAEEDEDSDIENVDNSNHNNSNNRRRNRKRRCNNHNYQDNRDDISSMHSSAADSDHDLAQEIDIIPDCEEYETEGEQKEVDEYNKLLWKEPDKDSDGNYKLAPIHQRHILNKKTPHRNRKGPNIQELSRLYKSSVLPKYIKKIHEKWSTEKDSTRGYLGPVQIFWLFLTKLEILKLVPKWSNYRMKKIFESNRLKSIKDNWKDMDKNILMMVSVLILYMGTVQTAKLTTFWNDTHGVKAVYEIMSKDKFMMWRRSITLYNPNKAAPEGEIYSDKAYKVKHFFDNFKDVAKIFWHMDQNLAVDEQILEMKNRSKLKRRIKSKIHSIGAKLWKIANRSGYNYAYLIDCKETKHLINSMHATDEYTVGGSILLWFIKTLRLKNHNIYADRWFNSLPATIKALDYQTTITGTIAKGRKYIHYTELTYVDAHKKQKVQKDKFKILINDEYPIITFCGKNKIHFYMISSSAVDWTKTVQNMEHTKNISDSEEEYIETKATSRKRKRSGRQKKSNKKRRLDHKTVGKNIMNQDYNDYMIGVDVNNALCQTYSSGRRTKKWTLHFYMELLNVIVANSMVLYNNTTANLPSNKKISKLQFIYCLYEDLLPELSSNIVQNTKVRKQQHQKKIHANIWNKEKSEKILKAKGIDKDITSCRTLKKKRSQYHKNK